MMARPSVINLYSGCGGVSLAFIKRRFQLLAMVDPEPVNMKIANFNLRYMPVKLFTGAPNRILPQEIKAQVADIWSGEDHKLGVVTVTPSPDVPASEIGGAMTHLHELKPHIFVIAVTRKWLKHSLPQELNDLESEYSIDMCGVNASEYGVPQSKKILFAIGVRRCVSNGETSVRDVVCPPFGEQVSLWDAIQDLPVLKPGEIYNYRTIVSHSRNIAAPKKLMRWIRTSLPVYKEIKWRHHRAISHSERDIRNFKRILPGESGRDAWLRGERMEFHPHVEERYFKLRGNTVSKPISRNFTRLRRRFLHPTQNRSLTVAEVARIHTFPDGFQFPDSEPLSARMMADSVPPYLAFNMADNIKNILEKSCNG